MIAERSVAAEAVAAGSADSKKKDVNASERKWAEENRATKFTGNRNPSDRQNQEEKHSRYSSGGLMAMIFVVLVVAGFALWMGLAVFRKFMPGSKNIFSCAAIEVLGRTHVEQQKYVALMRVGKRLLVVGVSGAGFDNLAEITDEEEVADIMAVAAPKNSAGKNLFHRLFQKQLQQQDESAGEADKPEGNKPVDNRLEDIQARIRSLREQE